MNVPFHQLLTSVRTLTASQKAKLKQALTEDKFVQNDKSEYISMLLNGPVFTEDEINTIEENRKSIKRWREKS